MPTKTDQLEPQYLNMAQVATLLGMSVPNMYRLRRQGRFPAPIRLNARCVRWDRNELQTWLEGQK